MEPNHASSGRAQFAPAFGGIMNDHTAQMGFQIGKSAAMAGQEYMEQNVSIECIQRKENRSVTDHIQVESLRVRRRPEALFQCHNSLCSSQACTSVISVATQAMVSSTTAIDFGISRI